MNRQLPLISYNDHSAQVEAIIDELRPIISEKVAELNSDARRAAIGDLMTQTDAAKALGISYSKVNSLVRKGKIASYGHREWVSVIEIRDYRERCEKYRQYKQQRGMNK